ncbi:DUF1847 domain-containing protein [Candidatus Bipolaricaulota bacterium]|nr:DUF1847 domain-containing protein [Candidatus Bipolaricaulota bacterium]
MADKLNCARCKGYCGGGEIKDKDDLPDFCPMINKEQLLNEAKSRYLDSDLTEFYSQTTLIEKEGYEEVRGKRIPVRPRIVELIELGKKLGMKKIGIAFCSGLSEEAKKIVEILENKEFEVSSVRCKCGNFDKTELGVPKKYKIGNPKEYEAGCNPLAQAYLLNDVPTDINVIVGLCVGHDMIFTKESQAPVTTLIVKDRYTGHNPATSIYNNYHKRAFLED